MTTRTTQELATAVLRRISGIDINKEPTAAQRAEVTRLYEEKLAELIPQDKIYWEEDEIPLAVFGAMTRIIAEEFAPSIGMSTSTEMDEGGDVVSMGEKGLRMLKRHMARAPSGVPTKAQYF
jgi:hypothetical protein